jgi:transposase InsO family protein
MCRVLEVSRAGFYRAQGRARSARAERDDELLMQIHLVHHLSHQRYGAPRVHQALRQTGETVGRHRIARLMREEALVGAHQRRWRRAAAPITDPALLPDQNHVRRQFAPSPVLNQTWVADITYLHYRGRRAYLAVVLDLASRAVIGWTVDEHMQVALIDSALQQAIATRRPARGTVHHSDRGAQYTSTEYQHRLTQHGLIQSVSAKGNCYDNAVVESFFATLKRECDFADCESLPMLRAVLFEYLEIFYNRERMHSSLGFYSPLQYEKQLDHSGRAA